MSAARHRIGLNLFPAAYQPQLSFWQTLVAPKCAFHVGEFAMLSTIIIVILILALVGALPTWRYSSRWGYGPGGLLGTILVVVVVLALLQQI